MRPCILVYIIFYDLRKSRWEALRSASSWPSPQFEKKLGDGFKHEEADLNIFVGPGNMKSLFRILLHCLTVVNSARFDTDISVVESQAYGLLKFW